MNPTWLRFCANALLVLSALDAGLSLAEEGLRAGLGVEWLLGPRNALARLVAVGMLALLPALLATPRLPLSVFLPLALGTLWLALGAAPLPLYVAPGAVGLAGASIQLGLVAAALLLVRRRNGGRGWLFHPGSPAVPAFVWQRTLGLAAAGLLLGMPAAAAYCGVALATAVQLTTQGFVHFDWRGVSLADRRYALGDRDVRLVGMVHIGEEQAYRELVASFSKRGTLVLAEGVSDRQALLRGDLSYGRAAQALGLQPQRDLRSYLLDPGDSAQELPEWPRLRAADLDASAFAPETRAWIAWAGELWRSDDLVEAVRAVVLRASLQDPHEWEIVQADILDARNEHLIGELDAALAEYPHVIVPWGALHLPAVERALLDRGFEPTQRQHRRLASWSTIAAALF